MNKALILSVFLVMSGGRISAQYCKLDIALSGGFYKTPDYKRAQSKYFLAIDFDYHLSKRWTISSGFLSGKFAYYEDYRNNTTGYGDPYRNADGYESHTYFTASYTFIYKHKFNLHAGSGVGLFTQRLKYPLQLPSSYGTPSLPGGSIITAEESFSIAEIPLKIEGYFLIKNRLGLGVRAGTYIQFSRPLSGTYIGPQIRLRI